MPADLPSRRQLGVRGHYTKPLLPLERFFAVFVPTGVELSLNLSIHSFGA